MALVEQVFIRFLGFQRMLEKVPQLEIAHEIRAFTGEFGMCVISRFTLIHRPFTRVLYAQHTGNDEDFP